MIGAPSADRYIWYKRECETGHLIEIIAKLGNIQELGNITYFVYYVAQKNYYEALRNIKFIYKAFGADFIKTLFIEQPTSFNTFSLTSNSHVNRIKIYDRELVLNENGLYTLQYEMIKIENIFRLCVSYGHEYIVVWSGDKHGFAKRSSIDVVDNELGCSWGAPITDFDTYGEYDDYSGTFGDKATDWFVLEFGA